MHQEAQFPGSLVHLQQLPYSQKSTNRGSWHKNMLPQFSQTQCFLGSHPKTPNLPSYRGEDFPTHPTPARCRCGPHNHYAADRPTRPVPTGSSCRTAATSLPHVADRRSFAGRRSYAGVFHARMRERDRDGVLPLTSGTHMSALV